MKKKAFYAVSMLLAWLALTSSYSQTFSIVSPVSDTAIRSAYLAFENDAFGMPLVGEWDDLRTFGFLAGVALPHLCINFAYTSLTNRAETEDYSLRDDLVTMSVGFRKTWEIAERFAISAGVGGLILGVGDFHGLEIQRAFHSKISAVARPVPSIYATPEGDFTFGAISNVSLSARLGSMNLGGYLSFQLDGFGSFTYRADLIASEPVDSPHISLGLEYQGNSGVGSPSPVILTAMKADKGFWLFDCFSSNAFNFETRWNPITNISTGAVKVTFGRSEAKNAVKRPRAIEFGMPLGNNAYEARYRFAHLSLHSSEDSGVDMALIIDRVSGWTKEPSTTYEQNEAYRFLYAALGLDLSRQFAGGHLVPFVDAFAGIKIDTLHDQPESRARLIEAETSFGMTLEAGMRALTSRVADGTRIGLSLSPALEWLPISGTLLPSVRLRLISEVGR